jgi:hypothetical protein
MVYNLNYLTQIKEIKTFNPYEILGIEYTDDII